MVATDLTQKTSSGYVRGKIDEAKDHRFREGRREPLARNSDVRASATRTT